MKYTKKEWNKYKEMQAALVDLAEGYISKDETLNSVLIDDEDMIVFATYSKSFILPSFYTYKLPLEEIL